jgi:hypothetical protein
VYREQLRAVCTETSEQIYHLGKQLEKRFFMKLVKLFLLLSYQFPVTLKGLSLWLVELIRYIRGVNTIKCECVNKTTTIRARRMFIS